MGKHKILMFDLDGTLVDSRRDLATAINLTLADYGQAPLSVETVASYLGDGARQLMARCFDGADVDLDEATRRMGGYYERHLLDATRVYDGIVELLECAAAKGFQLAVVTNKIQESARQIVDGLGIGSHFSVVLGDDGQRELKPSPEPLREALKRTACEPEGSWMIGDNHTDLKSGHAGGVQTCFCEYGFGKTCGQPSDLSICSPTELIAALRE